MVGAGAPRGTGAPVGATEPSPGQLRSTLASRGRLWCGPAWLCMAGPGQVRPDLARCGRALLMWHVGFNFSQNVYLPMKFTTQLVELYFY
jgi:hypothetical protein